MKLLDLKSLLSRSMRFVIAAFACSLLLISSAFPALAVTSSPTEGEAQLNKTLDEAYKVIEEGPRSPEKVQAKAEKGPNAVQGDADIDKMSTPENSQDATSVPEQINEFVKGIKGSK